MMTIKIYKEGWGEEGLPCVELDDGTIINEPEIFIALIKVLIKKRVIKLSDLKGEIMLENAVVLPFIKRELLQETEVIAPMSLGKLVKDAFNKIKGKVRVNK